MKEMGKKFRAWMGKMVAFAVLVLTVTFLASVETWAYTSFEQDGVTYELSESYRTARVTDYSGTLASIVIPATVEYEGIEYSVTKIKYAVFKDYSSLEQITLPDSITEIGKEAFYGCSNLSVINMPADLEWIGEYAFRNCSKIQTIIIPSGVTSIEDGTFYGCEELSSIVISGDIKRIGSFAFYGCDSLEKVALPNSVDAIGLYAFYGCSALKSINIPYGVTSIGGYTFYECGNLREITLPDSVTTIGTYAFYSCTSLKKLDMSDSVISIGAYAFEECSALESIVIPNGVTSIENYTFVGCENLTSISLPSSVTSIGQGALSYCGFETLVIPDSVTSIGYHALFASHDMQYIYWPSDLSDDMAEASIYHMTVQFSYTTNEDGTISLKVEQLPEGMTDIQLPGNIDGKPISSVSGLENAGIEITCTNHYFTAWSNDAESHWYICSTCKKEIKDTHSYGTGLQPCECGYVPFTITAQPSSLSLKYAKSGKLSVTVKKTFGTEKISSQWYENGKVISGATSLSYNIPKGKKVGTYTYTCKLTSGGYSQVTKTATVTVKAPAKGSKYKDDKNMATYKVTKARIDGKGTVEYVKAAKKNKSTVTIPATVKIGGVTYKVTGIAKNAFKNNRYIKRLTIEKNVEKIGAKAFYGCKKLKTITIKTSKLKTKKIGANAFKNIKSNATIKVPKKKLKA